MGAQSTSGRIKSCDPWVGVPEEVTIYSDSALIVNQVLGKWKVKDSRMEGCCMTARDLINIARNRGKKVKIVQIPRSQNKAADALVNRILDQSEK